MSPTTKRRILLVALVAPGLTGVLAGCAGEAIHGYLWKFDATMPVCSSVTWHQVSPNQIPGMCSDRGRAAAPGTSCAIGCLVVSASSAAEAKHIDLWGESLYAHESRHVLERKAHPQ